MSFSEFAAPIATASRAGVVGEVSMSGRGMLNPTTLYARYAQATMPIIAISGLCDHDNTGWSSPPFPASTTALQFFQRLWNLYDKMDLTYTGGGLQPGVVYHTDDYLRSGTKTQTTYTGTFQINNSIVGPGRVPTVNNYCDAFSQRSTDEGADSELTPYGTPYEDYLTTIAPDPGHTGSDITIPYPGIASGVFDYYHFGPGTPPNPVSTYTWYPGGVAYSSDAYFTYTQSEYNYTLAWSSATDVAGLYNRAHNDFTALSPFPTSWATGATSLGYKMAPNATAGYDPATYDGSSYTAVGTSSGPGSYPPALGYYNAVSGWDIASIGTDGGTVYLFRGQARTNDGRAHYYWIGNIKWSNLSPTGIPSSLTPPGSWKMRISFVREGWMYPNPATSNESRVEVDFPLEKGWPIINVSGQPVTTEYNFVVVDQTPAEWLAANASTFPSGFGDYTF